MAVIIPWIDNNEWFLYGDECGPREPGEKRFFCYSVCAIPGETQSEFFEALPIAHRGRFGNHQFKEVYDGLVKSGGFGLCVYFNMSSPMIAAEKIPVLEAMRRQSELAKDLPIESSFWLYGLSFAFLECLALICTKSLPVGKCHFIYDGRSLHKRAKEVLTKQGADIVDKMRNFLAKVKAIDSEGVLSRANPKLDEFREGRTKEPGIRVADFCAWYAYARLTNSNLPVMCDYRILDRTDMLRPLPEQIHSAALNRPVQL